MVTAVGDTVAARVGTPTITRLRSRARHLRTVIDLVLIALLGAALLRLFLWPTLRHAYPFPVGPDVPVYLWWTRVATAGGIALASERPGAPAADRDGHRRAGPGAGRGPRRASVRARARDRPRRRRRWHAAAVAPCRAAAGSPPGCWPAHGRRSWAAGTCRTSSSSRRSSPRPPRSHGARAGARSRRRSLLGGGAITHPGFFVVGAVVLATAAVWARLHEGRFGWNTDAGRVVTALVGGVAIAAAGLAVATIGGTRIAGETSTDAFLRATGQLRALRRSYLDRFLVNWRRYSPFMTVALATRGSVPCAWVRTALPAVVGGGQRRRPRAGRRDRLVSAGPDLDVRLLSADARRLRTGRAWRATRPMVAGLADRDRADRADRRAGRARLARSVPLHLARRGGTPHARRTDRHRSIRAGHAARVRGRLPRHRRGAVPA